MDKLWGKKTSFGRPRELEFCSTFLVLNDDPKSRSDSIETSKVDGKSLIGMLLEIGLY